MPRANRYCEPGHTYHVTHRCHDRAFLFRFAIDRQKYRSMMRERLARHGISLLTYCITSNHTHLLLRVRNVFGASLSRFMQSLEGDFAQYYNQRKKRQGAFWSDRYHAVMVQHGRHLRRCLIYIDLNMVRAGTVSHPGDWEWTGYSELLGGRRRNRLIDAPSLLRALDSERALRIDDFRRQHREAIEEALYKRELRRHAYWTESIAVGDESWVRALGARIRNRMRVEIEEGSDGGGVWRVRELRPSYSTRMDRFSDAEIAP